MLKILTKRIILAAVLLSSILNLQAQHYLVFASDRHENMSAVNDNTPVVYSAMGVWMDLPVEYVSLIGDMVGKSGGDAPAYDVNDVWKEVNALFPSLTSDQFSIIWADHDGGYTDPSGLDVMKVPSSSSSDYGNKSAHIYTGPNNAYYIYAINYYEMLNATTTPIETFKTWVDGIDDKSAPIIVLCHAPMHYLRKDNLNGANWTDALNYAATGSVNGTNVVRNVVFYHGHNHTTENMEYYYEPGTAVNMQGSSGSVSKTIQFTYITAGYMKKPNGATTINASLLTIDDEQLTFTKSKSGTTTVLGTVERVEQGDVTYFDVTFETNGGTAVASQRVKEGNSATEPAAPTREGWIFDGWYADEPFTTEYDFSLPVTAPTTIYAKWTEDTTVYYTITFDTDGGSEVAAQRIAEGMTATEPANPTKSGYTFEGWYADEALTTLYDFTTPVTTDLTLYAKWAEKEVTSLTFAYSGTATSGEAYLIVSNGYAMVNNNGSLSAVAVTVDGDNVVFEGTDIDEEALLWTVGSDGSLKNGDNYVRRGARGATALTLDTQTSSGYTNWSYDGTQVTVTGNNGSTYYMNYADGWVVSTTSASTSTKLYSKVETPVIVYHTVTFETNGGTEVEPQTVEDGKILGPIGETTREGYTFEGWYTDETLETEFNPIRPVVNDMTLYAKWTAITYYTVTFNTNGGSEVASQKIEEGKLAEEPLSPTLNGFTFAGWYADEALTEEFDFTKAITADVTIYAKWEAVMVACATPVLEFKGGKVVCTCATEGVTYKYKVELTNTEGECTDGVIQIGPAVNITVVATREGMLDSVPAAIMFNLPQVGDLNGDGAITIADVTALVDVILGK